MNELSVNDVLAKIYQCTKHLFLHVDRDKFLLFSNYFRITKKYNNHIKLIFNFLIYTKQ